MHCDLDLWPFDLKIYRAHPWLMGSLHVKFHDDRCKGKAVMRRKPNPNADDRRTWWFQYIPPNFIAGVIKRLFIYSSKISMKIFNASNFQTIKLEIHEHVIKFSSLEYMYASAKYENSSSISLRVFSIDRFVQYCRFLCNRYKEDCQAKIHIPMNYKFWEHGNSKYTSVLPV